MGLSRTVSEIDGDFIQKSQDFPMHTCILRPRWRGSLGLGYRRWGQKTRMMVTPGRERSLTISLAVIQSTNVTDGQTDRQTDGRTDTERQH